MWDHQKSLKIHFLLNPVFLWTGVGLELWSWKWSGTSYWSSLMYPNMLKNILSSEIYHLTNFDILTQCCSRGTQRIAFTYLCTYHDVTIISFFHFHFLKSIFNNLLKIFCWSNSVDCGLKPLKYCIKELRD